MEKRVDDHIKAIREQLIHKRPDIIKRLTTIEANGPNSWEDIVSECDLLLHEEKHNAIAHERLHAHEIKTVEKAIDEWDATDLLQRYSIYLYLLWLKRQHAIDESVDQALQEAEKLANQTLPPTSKE